MVEVDAGDHEGHVGIHPIRPRGADRWDVPCVEGLEFARRLGFDRREDEADTVEAHRLGVLDFELERRGRRFAAIDVPSTHPTIRVDDRFFECLASRALGRGERSDFEIRMVLEGGQHLLTRDTGGAYDCDWNLHHCDRIRKVFLKPIGDACARPAIYIFASIQSSTSVNNSSPTW